MPEVADTLPPGPASYCPGGFFLGTSINEKGLPNFKADGKKRGKHKDLSYAFLNFSVYR